MSEKTNQLRFYGVHRQWGRAEQRNMGVIRLGTPAGKTRDVPVDAGALLRIIYEASTVLRAIAGERLKEAADGS